MPFGFSQDFHKMLWGSQSESSQDQSSQMDCKSQNETWQNESNLSQSLLGSTAVTQRGDLFHNRTTGTYTVNTPASNVRRQETDYTGTIFPPMPQASAQRGSIAGPTPAKYTIPMWVRSGFRPPAGNSSLSQPQPLHQSNVNLNPSIQVKRMEAQQRDVKEYLLSLVGSIDQLKKAFALGQEEVVEHIEQFIVSKLTEKLSENNGIIKNLLDANVASIGDAMKKTVITQCDGMFGKLNDNHELFEKYSRNEMGKTRQLEIAVSETMNLLGQIHSQVSCVFEILESSREDKVQKLVEQNDLAMKTAAQQKSLISELDNVRNEVERLADGQVVIREDMADVLQKTMTSFKEFQHKLNKILLNFSTNKESQIIVKEQKNGSNSTEKSCMRIENNGSRLRESTNREISNGMFIENKEHFSNPAEIPTRLESEIFNSRSFEATNHSNIKAPIISTSFERENLNKSYILWDLASKDKMPGKKDIVLPEHNIPKLSAGSMSLLPNTSTPKPLGIVRPNVSGSTMKGGKNVINQSGTMLPPKYSHTSSFASNNRSNKRAELKKRRMIKM